MYDEQAGIRNCTNVCKKPIRSKKVFLAFFIFDPAKKRSCIPMLLAHFGPKGLPKSPKVIQKPVNAKVSKERMQQ